MCDPSQFNLAVIRSLQSTLRVKGNLAVDRCSRVAKGIYKASDGKFSR